MGGSFVQALRCCCAVNAVRRLALTKPATKGTHSNHKFKACVAWRVKSQHLHSTCLIHRAHPTFLMALTLPQLGFDPNKLASSFVSKFQSVSRASEQRFEGQSVYA